MGRDGRIVLLLAGNVMTGRGIDQILMHPVDPALHEPLRAFGLVVWHAARRHRLAARSVGGHG
jgi:hypothetical protein